MNPWRLLKPLVILGLVGGAAWGVQRYAPSVFGTDAKEEGLGRVGTVERRDLTIKVTIAGGIVPKRKALITPPYNGYIRKLFVKVGDRITAGEPVVSIAQMVTAAADDTFPLRAPLTGTVVQVMRSEGEYVNQQSAGTAGDNLIVRIDDMTKLYVQAAVPEIEVGKLKDGLGVLVRAVAIPEKQYKGKILEIAQAAKDQDRWERSRVEFPLTVELLDPDANVKPGMSAVMDIIVKEAKGVLTLPHEFVQRDEKGYFVTAEDGKRRDIEVGLQNEEAFEIKAGVDEGMRVRQVDFLAGGRPS